MAAAPEPVAAPVDDFGDPDAWGWDDWDGEGYDKFPEKLRPWVEKATGKVRGSYTEKLTAAQQEQQKAAEQAAYHERLWKASLDGSLDEERITAAQTEAANHKTVSQRLAAENKQLKADKAKMAEESGKRYATWFNQTHKEKLSTPEGKAAFSKAMDMCEEFEGLEAHEAMAYTLLGDQAITWAKQLLTAGNTPETVQELIDMRLARAAADAQAAERAANPQPKHSAAADITNTGEDAIQTQNMPGGRGGKGKDAYGRLQSVASQLAKEYQGY